MLYKIKKEEVHIIPCKDIKEHKQNKKCKCKPRVERHKKGSIIVHNSYDGREIKEG